MRRLVAVAGLLAIATITAAEDVETDGFTGFPMTGDWELVRANCIACHSPRLVTQQRGTAEQWLAMIRWMQEKQNLWALQPEVEQKIVAYLAEHFPPSAERRRAAIPPDLMPPNPYTPATTSAVLSTREN